MASAALSALQAGQDADLSGTVDTLTDSPSPQIQPTVGQTLTITATGGTYTLTFDGQTTSTLDFDADADTIQAALTALTNIGSGNVTVTLLSAGVYLIMFQALKARTTTAIVVNTGSLTGGTATITVGPDATTGVVGIFSFEQTMRSVPVANATGDSIYIKVNNLSAAVSATDYEAVVPDAGYVNLTTLTGTTVRQVSIFIPATAVDDTAYAVTAQPFIT